MQARLFPPIDELGHKPMRIVELARKFFHLKTTTVEERRREIREQLSDGTVIIEGRSYPINNWSASGIGIGPTGFLPNIGRRLQMTARVPLESGVLTFDATCMVVRRSEKEGIFGGTYFGVDEESRAVIDEHFRILTEASFKEELLQEIEDTKSRLTKK